MLYDICVVVGVMILVYIAGVTICNPEKKKKE